MNTITFTRGISGSGKTTWAYGKFLDTLSDEDYSTVNINRDDIRFHLFTDGIRDWTKYKHTKANENKVTGHQKIEIEDACNSKLDIVISDTNLNPTYIKRITDMYCLRNYKVVYKDFDITFEEALKRNYQREGGVPYEVLLRQYISYQHNIKGVVPYNGTEGKPEAYIVDLDGTLCNNNGRSPHDETKVGEDLPINHVCEMVTALWQGGYKIIFLSGRSINCHDETRKWLSYHLGYWSTHCILIMRPNGNNERDSVIKMNAFDNFIRHSHNVVAVMDDRKQVIEETWSVLGIPTINVGKTQERF